MATERVASRFEPCPLTFPSKLFHQVVGRANILDISVHSLLAKKDYAGEKRVDATVCQELRRARMRTMRARACSRWRSSRQRSQ